MTEPYRVLVTGSRSWDDKDFIWNVLDILLSELGDLTVVHGACPKGADTIAQGWVRHQLVNGGGQVRAERHPADWSQGKSAGYRRNQAMVDAGADLCLCFAMPCTDPRCTKPSPHDSHGASHCADRAEAAGISVRRFRADDPRLPNKGAFCMG